MVFKVVKQQNIGVSSYLLSAEFIYVESGLVVRSIEYGASCDVLNVVVGSRNFETCCHV